MIFHENRPRQTILVKHHTLFCSKIGTDVTKFVVSAAVVIGALRAKNSYQDSAKNVVVFTIKIRMHLCNENPD